MRITEGIEAINEAIYLHKHKTLVISDIHIGYEELLASAGALVPRFQLKDMIDKLESIFSRINGPVEKIILNGDVKHEFGRISEQEWREVLRFFDYLSAKTNEVIIVKGNHDVQLGPVARKREITAAKNYIIGDILIAHGDALNKDAQDKKISTIIIGHEHPAISLRENSKTERFKCFLVGKWKGGIGKKQKALIVQPSFNPLIEGTDVVYGKSKLLSPYIKSLENMEVYVPHKEKVLYFGRVKSLR